MRKSSGIKAFSFLAILSVLDMTLRDGVLERLFGDVSSTFLLAFVFYSLFAALALTITVWFCRWDGIRLKTLGIGLDRTNRRDFLCGLVLGVIVWSLVSFTVSASAGFSWEFQLGNALINMWIGLIFIFIADLGTELYVRGYGLTGLKTVFGPYVAIAAISTLVGLRSYSPSVPSETLFYVVLIPTLHAILFSIVYFKTGRLGASVGIHTGGNFATISLFDFGRKGGLLHPDIDIQALSIHSIQLPFVAAALLLIVFVCVWTPAAATDDT